MKGTRQRLRQFAAHGIGILLLAGLLITGIARIGTAQEISTQDYTRITQVPRAEMDTWLKQEVATSGGNWNTDRYHFYIGFSTGHFGQDPVQAIAMRRMAFSLINNSLAAGDHITAIAWEMSTWNVGPTVTLTEDPARRAEFVDRVPYAPHTSSHGGHDIDRVLYETITQAIPVDETQSAIVLLLTNSNQSQGPTGERASLFGPDNPLLLKALDKGGFRQPPIRKEFQFMAGSQPVTVAVTALLPQKLTSLPYTPVGPRYPTFARDSWQPTADRPATTEALPNPVRLESTPPHPHTGIPGWVWGALLLLALVLVGAFVLLSRKPKTASPGNVDTKSVPATPQGAPIPGSLAVTIGLEEQTLAPLTTASRWTLQRDADGKSVLLPVEIARATNTGNAPAPATGTPLAKLAFDAKRILRVEAELGTQFIELQGTAAGQSESSLLLLEPGKRVLCRVVPSDVTTKTRFEIKYDAQKGS